MLSLVVNSLSLNLGAAPAPRVARAGSLSMMAGTATLNPELTKTYPRDFAAVPFGTAYGEGADEEMNKKEEDARLEAKLALLKDNLQTMVEPRDRLGRLGHLVLGRVARQRQLDGDVAAVRRHDEAGEHSLRQCCQGPRHRRRLELHVHERPVL